jgi:hypothetical protein
MATTDPRYLVGKFGLIETYPFPNFTRRELHRPLPRTARPDAHSPVRKRVRHKSRHKMAEKGGDGEKNGAE